ncbi:hypothetical protein MMC07_001099 [Pseudocyphellaria aurata]|nr:hypothetical protein [Pseudocyphellaria aurata]
MSAEHPGTTDDNLDYLFDDKDLNPPEFPTTDAVTFNDDLNAYFAGGDFNLPEFPTADAVTLNDNLDSYSADRNLNLPEFPTTDAVTFNDDLNAYFAGGDFNFPEIPATDAVTSNDNLNHSFADENLNLQNVSAINTGAPGDNLEPLFADSDAIIQKLFEGYLSPTSPWAPQVSQQSPVQLPQPVSNDLPFQSNCPIQPTVDPRLLQVQADDVHTDFQSANKSPNQVPPAPESCFYPDPSQSANEVRASPYFVSSGALNQTREHWPAPFKNGMPFPALNHDQAHGSPPNQDNPLQNSLVNTPVFDQYSQQYPPPQPGIDVQDHSLEPTGVASKPSKVSRKYATKKSAVNTSKRRTLLCSDVPQIPVSPIIAKTIRCSDYQSLTKAPESWDCFEYNANGELEPDRTYSAEEIERYLFQNPQHFTPNGYSPKLGGLTLWIQRAPRRADQCHKDHLGYKCRFKNCHHGGTIAEGQLRVAFDENTRACPIYNPQHNAGYVHLKCLENFLALPNICTQLNVKAEDRVLSDESLKKNCMILRDVTEADLLTRFIDFCSTNGRGPASYPSMHSNVRDCIPEHTLKQEIQALEARRYTPRMQQVWETQGRYGVMVENERLEAVKQQNRLLCAELVAQENERGESDLAHYEINTRGRKRARTAAAETAPPSRHASRRGSSLEAAFESHVQDTQYQQRVRRRGRGRPRAKSAPASSSESGYSPRTRAPRRRRAASPLPAEPEITHGSRGSSVEKVRRVTKKGAVAKVRSRD